MARGLALRLIKECALLEQAEIPHCLCIGKVPFPEADPVGDSWLEAPRTTVLCEVKYPIIYTVVALPVSLCGGNDSVDALVAFVLPPAYPFKPPRAFMLSPGVFMPSSQCRGSGKHVGISKVPALQEEWSPALFLHEVCGLILSELGDMSKWKMFLTRDECKLLPVLHASCTPCSLPQTLATQDWLPTALSRLGRQWRDMRVGSTGSRLPETVLNLLQTFIGKLDFMLSMSRFRLKAQ